MGSHADGSVIIQTSAASVPSTPSWFGEVVLIAKHLQKHGALTKISEQVRFVRKRFGRYEVIDFLAVLFGYAISGECTLEAFYERLQPFAIPFMALFDRDRLPARSTLSRFLAALIEAPVEALRTLFLDDVRETARSRPTPTRSKPGAWWIERGTPGWSLTSMGRWDAGGGPPARVAADRRSASRFSPVGWRVRSWLHRTQTWTGGTDAHDHQPGPQFPVARLVWQSRQRALPPPRCASLLKKSHHSPTLTRDCPAKVNGDRRSYGPRSFVHAAILLSELTLLLTRG